MSKELLLKLRQYITDELEQCELGIRYAESQEEIEYIDGVESALRGVEIWIDEQPVNDVKPIVRGEWIRRQSWSEGFGMGESYGFYWECSICGRQTKGDYDECGRNFCHNCGADMRERSKK